MKINLVSIKSSEQLSLNEYVLTTAENDLVHVALVPGDGAIMNLSIRINGSRWHHAEVSESEMGLFRQIREYHFNQQQKKHRESRERAAKVAASLFS